MSNTDGTITGRIHLADATAEPTGEGIEYISVDDPHASDYTAPAPDYDATSEGNAEPPKTRGKGRDQYRTPGDYLIVHSPTVAASEEGQNIRTDDWLRYVTPVEPYILDDDTEHTIALIERYAQRKGHLLIPTAAQLAEADGMVVKGDYMLLDAKDPRVLIWSNATLDFAHVVIELGMSEVGHYHPVPEGDIAEIDPRIKTPSMPYADRDRWYHLKPQDPTGGLYWLPMVLCADEDGDLAYSARESYAAVADRLRDMLKRMGLTGMMASAGGDAQA